MAKFCGKCGAELRDSATFCDSCGAKCAVINAPTENTATPETVVASTAPAVQEASPTSDVSAPKKKSKKVFLIAIIAAVLVVAITLTTIFVVLPMFKKATNKEYIVAGRDELMIETSYGTFYQGVGTFDVNIEGESLIPLKSYGQGNLTSAGWKCVTVDDTMYIVDTDDYSCIYKVTFTESANSEETSAIPQREEWLTQDDMYTTGYDNIGIITVSSRDWQYDNDYIYFYIWPSKEYFNSQKDYAFLFGRIHTGNKAIEIYNPDIAVISYVVYDGWVYYSENGWDRSTSRNTYDYEKAGIYKMRTDGSEKTKLRELTCLDTSEYSATGETAYTNLSIYDGKLYFIDNSNPRNSLLYRMDLDGGNAQQVSTRGTYEYTFDTASDTLYYVTGSLYLDNINDVKEVYAVTLDKFNESLIANYKYRSDLIRISCNDGKLYFHSYNQLFGSGGREKGTKEDPGFRGICYDLKNNTARAVYEYAIYETKTEDYGFTQIEQEIMTDEIFYWADYDSSDGRFTFYN